ncbi:MAG: alpha/beta fold hydrolase [Woeseiaceae bacterium]|nr:alpha/beta fold hydrolase [Woeseiaceae bacterium]
MRALVALLAIGLLAACSESGDREQGDGSTRRPPLAIEALRATAFGTTLRYVRDLDDGPGFSAYLVAYDVGDLSLHAMVAAPDMPTPEDGYPVVVANHGYVPDPRKYGITSDGRDARPGDYYRAVPELFTSRGFLTVLPDYRGHNSSEGIEYVDPDVYTAIGYYAEDVAALLAALGDIDQADTDRVYVWSHSMGGPVSLRALLATGGVRAASFWSTMDVDNLRPHLAGLKAPVILHHAVGDPAAAYGNSTRFADALRNLGREPALHSYDSNDHFFQGDIQQLAADRDALFFRAN